MIEKKEISANTYWIFPGNPKSKGEKLITFDTQIDKNEIDRQKQRARKLRQSAWWQRKVSKGICYYCGRHVDPGELTMDHIVPLIRGGKSTKGNLVPACKDCNNKKKYLLPIEWDEYLRSLGSRERWPIKNLSPILAKLRLPGPGRANRRVEKNHIPLLTWSDVGFV